MNLVINDFVADAAYGSFGEQAPLKIVFNWNTDVVSFDSGIEQRNQIRERPIREWFVNWQWMDVAARDKLIELFQRAKGRATTFLYQDYDDFSCALTECSVTAIAAQTDFQLIKSYYVGETETWDEDKKDIMPSSVFAPVVKLDGVEKTEGVDYTLDDATGIVIFEAAPGAGVVMTANYQFYFRVRFESDNRMDTEHQKDFFSVGELKLVEVIS